MAISPESTEEPLEAFAERLRSWPLIGKNPIGFFTISVLGAWAFLNWFTTLRTIVRDYNPLPVWDYWQVAEHLERYKAFDLSVLWVQHNEHRIVFPESVFAADMLLFHGHQIFSLAVSFACYFGVWVVLAWAFNSDKAMSPTLRKAGICFAGIVIGWQGSSVVLSNTFLLQWTMLQLGVVLSLALLAASKSQANALYLAGAIISAAVATFSSGNGMLIWPILLVIGFSMRIPKGHLASLFVSAVLTVSLYFAGFRPSNDLQILALIEHPVYALGFVCSYLSMPMGALGQPLISVACGAFNLLSFLVLFRLAVRKKLLVNPIGIVLFGSFFFILFAAVLTAAGRMNVSDPKFLASLAARYVSLPLVNWAILLLVVLWMSARMKWEVIETSLVGLLAFLCLAGLTSALRPWITGNGSFIASQQMATLSVENGLSDIALERRLYPDPAFLALALSILSRNHVAIYVGTPEVTWLGKTVTTVFGVCDQQQAGSVIGLIPVLGGSEVIGTTPRGLNNSRVVFVNESRKIVGFGEEITAGLPAGVAVAAKGNRTWVGFINSRHGSKSFSSYLVRNGGKDLCPMGHSMPIASAQPGTVSAAPIRLPA